MQIGELHCYGLAFGDATPKTITSERCQYPMTVPGVVQYMQFRYQSGVLYKLKALGARHNMDITIEGFHSWMWRGLSYLLPFLFGGYVFQLYVAYTLYNISYHPEATWQVCGICKFFCIGTLSIYSSYYSGFFLNTILMVI